MSAMKKEFRFALIILVIFLLFFCLRGDYGISLNLKNDVLTVDGPEGFLFSVAYDELQSIQLGKNLELGTRVDGNEKYGYQYGVWTNDTLGQYQLCVMKSNDNYIVVRTNNENTLVFNLESEDTTAEFYQAFNQLLLESNYSVSFQEL